MKLLRRHPYLITLALLLVVFPVPAYAVGEEFVYGLVVGVFGLFVRLAAMLLNFGVNAFVIDFGGIYANTGVGYAVDTTWIILRDFVNMAFIFGFVYIGFKMILSSNDSNTRRWLVNLLLAALLVNFSLFVTKLTIDFSNQLAAQIVVGGLSSEYTTNSKGLREVDIGQSFMDRMGITSVFDVDPAVAVEGGWGYIFGSAILFMVTAFVFAAGGILLIIRFAVLNLFLVLSPLMFLSWILPPLKETMNRYWGMFLGRVFFAPIYLLFIYFSLQIITGLQTAIQTPGSPSNLANPDWAGTFQMAQKNSANIQESTLGTLPFFVLICIFMIASLVIAQKMGADGGTKAVALGKSLSNKTQRFAAKQTGGRLARGAGSLASSAEGSLNRGLGRMAQGGAASRAAARFLDRTAGAGLRNTQTASVAGSESYAARNTRVGQQNARLNLQQQESERAARVAAEQNNQNAADTSTEAGRTARRDANNATGGQMRRMSNDEIMAMVRANPALLQQAGFVQHLTDGHMTAIRDSGVLTNQQHTDLGNLRNDSVIDETTIAFDDVNATADELNTAFTELGQTIRNMSADRKAGLGAARLAREDVAMHLTDRDIEQLEQSGRLSATEIGNVRTTREQAQTNMANGNLNLGGGRTFAGQGTPQGDVFINTQRQNIMSDPRQAGHTPAALFSNANMVDHITPQALEQRVRNGITDAEALAIKTNLDRHINGLAFNDPARRAWTDWDRNSINARRVDLNI